jgi:hypothetical protein
MLREAALMVSGKLSFKLRQMHWGFPSSFIARRGMIMRIPSSQLFKNSKIKELKWGFSEI